MKPSPNHSTFAFSKLILNEKFSTDFGYYYFHIWGKPETLQKIQPADIIDIQFNEISGFYKSFDYNLQILNQTHGTMLVYGNSDLIKTRPDADAFFSKEQNIALAIKTADCIPVSFFNTKTLLYGNIHAGWRGLHDRIFPKTMDKIAGQNLYAMEDFRFIVGPHIHTNNYETSNDVYLKFDNCCSRPSPNTDKKYLDMEMILKNQFTDKGVKKENISWFNENTFQSSRYYSHRSHDTGRNFNVILFSEKGNL